MENNTYKTKIWKRILSMILAIIIGFGTFVTMTFGNLLLSDFVDIKTAFAAGFHLFLCSTDMVNWLVYIE